MNFYKYCDYYLNSGEMCPERLFLWYKIIILGDSIKLVQRFLHMGPSDPPRYQILLSGLHQALHSP